VTHCITLSYGFNIYHDLTVDVFDAYLLTCILSVYRGFAGAPGRCRPKKILVSQRSADKSAALKAEHPGLIDITTSNKELVDRSDIIFIGLLPVVAREILPQLVFNESKTLFSMMAAIDYEEIAGLLKLTDPSMDNLVKTVPLPSTAYRCGPAVMYPPNPRLEAILRVVSTPIVCETEANMKPMISITGHISSFYELMNTSQQFVESHGVDTVTARKFVTSFYSSLAQGAERSSERLEDLSEEAATPGGLNEQVIAADCLIFFIGVPTHLFFSCNFILT